jgi:hypothetical protein
VVVGYDIRLESMGLAIALKKGLQVLLFCGDFAFVLSISLIARYS